MLSAFYVHIASPNYQRSQVQNPFPDQDRLKLTWKEGKKSPQKMRRAVHSVVASDCVYFRPWGSRNIYQYDSTHYVWNQLPDCLYEYSALAFVCNLLTSIGGEKDGHCTDELLSLTWKSTDKEWVEKFPRMLTKLKNPVTITTGKFLIVAGGIQEGRYLTKVDLLNTETKLWTTAASMPETLFNASVTKCEGHLYMLGGNEQPGKPTTTVLSCKVNNLLQSSCGLQEEPVWNRLADLPVQRSSCVSVCGHLIAVGGQKSSVNYISTLPSGVNKLSSSVYIYNQAMNSWSIIGDIGDATSECFAAALPGNKLMVLGGNSKQGVTDKVMFGIVDK